MSQLSLFPQSVPTIDDPIVPLSIKNHLLQAILAPKQLAPGDEPRYYLQLHYIVPAQFTLAEAQSIVQATDAWAFDPDTVGDLARVVNVAIAQSSKEVQP